LATWIAHLRIAERILSKNGCLHKNAFVVGNIASDAGVPNEDWSMFNPPTDRAVHGADYRKPLRNRLKTS